MTIATKAAEYRERIAQRAQFMASEYELRGGVRSIFRKDYVAKDKFEDKIMWRLENGKLTNGQILRIFKMDQTPTAYRIQNAILNYAIPYTREEYQREADAYARTNGRTEPGLKRALREEFLARKGPFVEWPGVELSDKVKTAAIEAGFDRTIAEHFSLNKAQRALIAAKLGPSDYRPGQFNYSDINYTVHSVIAYIKRSGKDMDQQEMREILARGNASVDVYVLQNCYTSHAEWAIINNTAAGSNPAVVNAMTNAKERAKTRDLKDMERETAANLGQPFQIMDNAAASGNGNGNGHVAQAPVGSTTAPQ